MTVVELVLALVGTHVLAGLVGWGVGVRMADRGAR